MGNTGSAPLGGGVVSLGPPKPLQDSPPPTASPQGWKAPTRSGYTSGYATPSRATTLERPSTSSSSPQSPQRNPLTDFPVFSPEARDQRMKGRKYGHFSKKMASPPPGEKENIRNFFDKNYSRDISAIQTPRGMLSNMTTPGTTAFNSAYTSRTGSLRGAGQPHFKRKKYRAPQPPFVNPRPSSPDSFASSSDGLRQMHHQRKKRRAPPPPTQLLAPPAEPTPDYSDDEAIKTTDVMDIDDDVPPPPVHSPPPPPPPALVIPAPPPPPPVVVAPPPPPPVAPLQAPPPQSPVHRMDSVLKTAIVRAAEERALRGPAEFPELRKPHHQLFAEELTEAYKSRQKRRVHGTVRLRTTGRSWVFHAKKKTHTMILRQMRDRIEPAGDLEATDDEDEFDPDEISDETEWIPEQDLEDDNDPFDDDSPTEALTSRTGNFYDHLAMPKSPESPTEKETKSPTKDEPPPHLVKLFKKNDKKDKHAQSKRLQSLSKFRKSLKGALGSLGRKTANPKKRQGLENVFKQFESDAGWEIFHAQDYDKAPEGPIRIKQIEKRPAYAYNQKKGTLIMLPEYDRVIVTEDGRHILEDSVTTIQRLRKSTNSDSSSPNEDAAWKQTLAEEKKEQMVAEMQFEQVRAMNKKFIERESKRRKKPVGDNAEQPQPDEIEQLNADLAQHASINKKESKPRRYRPKSDLNLDINKAKHKVLRKGGSQKLYMKEVDLEKRNPLYDSEGEGDLEDLDSPKDPALQRLEDSGYRSDILPATPMSTASPTTPMSQVLWPPPEGGAPTANSAPVMGVSLSHKRLCQCEHSPVCECNTGECSHEQQPAAANRHKELVIGPIGYRPVHFNPNAGKAPAPPTQAPPSGPPGRKSSQDSGTAGMGEEEQGSAAAAAPTPLYPQIVITSPVDGGNIPLEHEGLVAL